MDNEKPENKAKLMKKRTSPWTGEGTKPWMAEGRTMQEQLSRATQEQLPSVRLVHEHFEEVFVVPHIKVLWRVNAVLRLLVICAMVS